MRKNIVRFTVIVAMSLLSSIFISNSAEATPTVDQVQAIATNGSGGPLCANMGIMSINDALGSTFTAGITGDFTSVDIPILWTNASENLEVSVYALSGGVPSGLPLTVQTVNAAALTPLSGGGLLSVVFSTPAAVVSGNSYAFTLRFPSCVSTAQLSFDAGVSAVDKRLVFNQGSSPTWNLDNLYGLNFTTYVEPTTATVVAPVVAPAAESPSLALTGGTELFGQLWALACACFTFAALAFTLSQRVQFRKKSLRRF